MIFRVLVAFIVPVYSAIALADSYRFDSSRQIHFPPYAWYNAVEDTADGYFFMVSQAVASELGFSVKSVDLNIGSKDMREVALQRLSESQRSPMERTPAPVATQYCPVEKERHS